jgi:transcriptional regulator with PAS, ATPase and Fis domain
VAVPSPPATEPASETEGLNLKSALDNVEQRLLRNARERTAGNPTHAAHRLER